MKPINTTTIITQKKNCDWIIERAKELKALISYNDPKMIVLNKARAMSGITTMQEALEELKDHISEAESPATHIPPGLFSNKPPVYMRSFMFSLPAFGRLLEETPIFVEYWQQEEPGVLSYRVFTQPKWVPTRYFIANGVCRCPVLYELNCSEEEASAITLDMLQNKLIMDGIQDWYQERQEA